MDNLTDRLRDLQAHTYSTNAASVLDAAVAEIERLQTQLAQATRLAAAKETETAQAWEQLRQQLSTIIDDAEEAVGLELEDWGDGGEILRSGVRLRAFLDSRARAIVARLRALAAREVGDDG